MYFNRNAGAAGAAGSSTSEKKNARADKQRKQEKAAERKPYAVTGGASKASSGTGVRGDNDADTKSLNANATAGPRAGAPAKAPEEKAAKVIRVDIEINPAAAESLDDRYTLMSATDGGKAYKQTKTVKDDKVPGDKLVTLEFTDAPETLSYSLEIDLGKEGGKYFEFRNVPFKTLAG